MHKTLFAKKYTPMKYNRIIIMPLLIAAFIMLLGISCNSTFYWKHTIYNSELQSDLDSELIENIPGILVNITSVDNNISWSGASGFSDKDKKTKLLPNQTFRIASVTKTFVAATILRLWENKKLSLDDPITKYISKEHTDILKSGGYNPDKIYIRHLLTHSSGLSEHTNSDKYKIEFMRTRHVWTRTEQINDLVNYTKPIGAINEQFSYSDTGYILLGEIIEKITGKSMGDAILEELQLKKLGIKDTYMEDFNVDSAGRRIHQYFENVDTYYFHPSFDYYGGGGLLSTTSDLSCFYQSLFHHKIFHNQATLDTMLAPIKYKSGQQAMDYRMGIWKIEVDGMTAYTHSGFWGTQVVYIPEISTAVSVNYSQRWTKKGIAPIIPKIVLKIKKKNYNKL
jgi:D-alanyl-D-alanine carboxypeptidase